ncbi:transposase [Thiohalocapsa sp. ML1]|jgi:putative transposase|uniref:REP-associated tyrosine transposase n=1 Tax=Thiohalocapsa sp. ML1 TaxID=1431688 RepID=UPI0007322A83|nr:transposase [Thiohalocapsa sp. ML1]
MPTTSPTGWYSRGYHPHLNTPGLVQSVTTHLGDSMPRATLLRLMAETEHDDVARRRRLEDLLDAGHGACWLRRADIGALVEDALLAGDGEHYRLLAWVVMPNHLHVVIETLPAVALADVVRSWKGPTARAANLLIGRSGAFWERDYYDRYIRDDGHLAAVVRYVERNPVKAGLVARAEDWPFGSARRRGVG